MTNITNPKVLSVKEAANLLDITTMGIRMAIKTGRLKCKRQPPNGRILIKLDDLQYYIQNKYDRGRHYADDECNVKRAADLLDVDEQRIYHLLRTKRLPFYRKNENGMIAIKVKDIEELLARDR